MTCDMMHLLQVVPFPDTYELNEQREKDIYK